MVADLEESRVPLELREVAGPTACQLVEHHRLDVLSSPVYVLQRCNHGHKIARDEFGEQIPEGSFDSCLRDQPRPLQTCVRT